MGRCRLREEHARARALVARLQAGDPVVADLRLLLEAHFRFEEEALLPLLEGRLPSGTGPIPVIRDEHAALRRLLAGATPDVERIATLLHSHLEKEEELILPFAKTALTPLELARIGCPAHAAAPVESER